MIWAKSKFVQSSRDQDGTRGFRVSVIPVLGLLLLTSSARAKPPEQLAFRVGKVVTMDDNNRVLNNAVVLVRGGKIEKIGLADNVPIPDGYTLIDKPEHWLVPGLVDAHNHAAGSMRDLHDYVYLTNPGLRTTSALVPESENNKRARAGGVTTALMIPGSGNNLSGFGTLTKLAGDTVDQMLIRAPGSLKIAQAGNPERYWYGVGRSFMYYNLRQTLHKALAYHQRWERYENGETTEKPEFDIFLGRLSRRLPTRHDYSGPHPVVSSRDEQCRHAGQET